MKQRDKLDKDLSRLPEFHMDEERKRRNAPALKTPKKTASKYLIYPLTAVLVFVMLFTVYLLVFNNGEQTAITPEKNENTTSYFKGVAPIYSNAVISNTVKVKDNYKKNVALGYLYHAAIFYTPEGEEINPLTADESLPSYFDNKEEDTSYAQTKIVEDAKPTWAYLDAANSLIEDDSLSQELSDLSEQVTDIKSVKNFEYNYSIYREVSLKLATLVKEISQTANQAEVFTGENKDWFIRLQPIEGGDYLLYLSNKNYDSKDGQKAREGSISWKQEHFTKEFTMRGMNEDVYGNKLPSSFSSSEKAKFNLTFKGEKETITLKRVSDPQITRKN
ncbi:hypothetical protein Q7A53_09795 [Halobacillus rhizosphaerae]|uniref:hypothetical protein n=1 Tax=Halobacillus rhizosphaerae TaxID=3064889 RepID=UPI00398A7BDB